ncbi:hypothetical protein [Aliivibrio sp. S10_S31]|uniref:hypothetical protein n=1 Tax=Aliivibrio sp. S10_S31 TaxID=2720224 RepID=UPI001680522E|nr:hypothetical protein [Aliivibrio sp. S10_S31]MBD1571527.1 hypothetical protein [Aliivibrio sp. S10_S31]
MNLSVDLVIKYGSVTSFLISVLILVIINLVKKQAQHLGDLLVVGLAGSAVPTGFLLIYGAYDKAIIPKLSDAGIYLAFAGVALLIIFAQTLKEKA